jgi:hypothetical protein
MEHLGTPFAWSIVVVLAITAAAGMIGYVNLWPSQKRWTRSTVRCRQRHSKGGLA